MAAKNFGLGHVHGNVDQVLALGEIVDAAGFGAGQHPGKSVGPRPTPGIIIAATDLDPGIAVAARKLVQTRGPGRPVFPGIAVQRVIASDAQKGAIAIAAGQLVVPCPANEIVVARVAGQHIVKLAAPDIFEPDDHIADSTFAADGLGRKIDHDPALGCIIIQRVDAETTLHRIGAFDGIAASVAGDGIIAAAAINQVVAQPAADQVGPRAALQKVVAAAAIDAVGTAKGGQAVLIAEALHVVAPAVAGPIVIGRAKIEQRDARKVALGLRLGASNHQQRLTIGEDQFDIIGIADRVAFVLPDMAFDQMQRAVIAQTQKQDLAHPGHHDDDADAVDGKGFDRGDIAEKARGLQVEGRNLGQLIARHFDHLDGAVRIAAGQKEGAVAIGADIDAVDGVNGDIVQLGRGAGAADFPQGQAFAEVGGQETVAYVGRTAIQIERGDIGQPGQGQAGGVQQQGPGQRTRVGQFPDRQILVETVAGDHKTLAVQIKLRHGVVGRQGNEVADGADKGQKPGGLVDFIDIQRRIAASDAVDEGRGRKAGKAPGSPKQDGVAVDDGSQKIQIAEI